MKAFDIDKAKEGHPIVTRDGRKARILAFDVQGYYPLCVAITIPNRNREQVGLYGLDGVAIPGRVTPSDLGLVSQKQRAWINIWQVPSYNTYRYPTKEAALEAAEWNISELVDTIEIEWEE